MPRSKRSRVVPLTKTGKKGRERKEGLMGSIRDTFDSYKFVYVFEMENPRSSAMKDVRMEYRSSRFFLGKNKVMRLALGKTRNDAHAENTHLLSRVLRGNCGLMFSNEEPDNVIAFLSTYRPSDYAKPGFKATERVSLHRGLIDFPVSSEPMLRSLGLPVRINKGTLELSDDYVVCEEGKPLSVEQARILKLFKKHMSVFSLKVTAFWSDGKFSRVSEDGEYVVEGDDSNAQSENGEDDDDEDDEDDDEDEDEDEDME
eukprot:ANDGO_00849.mRNA.1 Ribosome assembly factor mrt4